MRTRLITACSWLALLGALACDDDGDGPSESDAPDAAPSDYLPVLQMCQEATQAQAEQQARTADDDQALALGCSKPFDACISVGATDIPALCERAWDEVLGWTNRFQSCTTADKAREYCSELATRELQELCEHSVLIVREASEGYCRVQTFTSCEYGPDPGPE